MRVILPLVLSGVGLVLAIGAPYQSTSTLPQAEGWRGLVPLSSTRRDVETVIGAPITPSGSSYETKNENVFVQYSDGPCEKGWPYGWSVERDTVIMISVSPKNSLTLRDLRSEER